MLARVCLVRFQVKLTGGQLSMSRRKRYKGISLLHFHYKRRKTGNSQMSSILAEEDRVLESYAKINHFLNDKFPLKSEEMVSADKFSVPRAILMSSTRGQQKMGAEKPWASSHQLR